MGYQQEDGPDAAIDAGPPGSRAPSRSPLVDPAVMGRGTGTGRIVTTDSPMVVARLRSPSVAADASCPGAYPAMPASTSPKSGRGAADRKTKPGQGQGALGVRRLLPPARHRRPDRSLTRSEGPVCEGPGPGRSLRQNRGCHPRKRDCHAQRNEPYRTGVRGCRRRSGLTATTTPIPRSPTTGRSRATAASIPNEVTFPEQLAGRSPPTAASTPTRWRDVTQLGCPRRWGRRPGSRFRRFARPSRTHCRPDRHRGRRRGDNS